jgi:hypothetical protein
MTLCATGDAEPRMVHPEGEQAEITRLIEQIGNANVTNFAELCAGLDARGEDGDGGEGS